MQRFIASGKKPNESQKGERDRDETVKRVERILKTEKNTHAVIKWDGVKRRNCNQLTLFERDERKRRKKTFSNNNIINNVSYCNVLRIIFNAFQNHLQQLIIDHHHTLRCAL